VCTPGDNSGIAEHPNHYVVDLDPVNPVHACLENVGKDAGSIAGSTIRSNATPVGRDYPFDCCSIAGNPGLGQNLLELCQHDFILSGSAPLDCHGCKAGHGNQRDQGHRQH
jgi:hypothetical protein